MGGTITTLDNSRYKKDYNKYFMIGDSFGTSHEIGNKELSDDTLTKIFDTINTIIIIFPNENGRLDTNLSYKIGQECKNSKIKIKELLNSVNLTVHSRELHKLDGADCKTALHYFEFDNYSDITKFLDWEELDEDVVLKVYTTLINEHENKKEAMTVNNIDNRVHNTDNSTHIDNSTKTEINNKGNFNKFDVGSKNKKSKSWWSKFIGFFKTIFVG